MSRGKEKRHVSREEKRQESREFFQKQWQKNKKLVILYFVLRVIVVTVAVAQVFNGNFANVFLCILTLVLFMIPSFIERRIKIDVPDTLEVIILLFIFSAEILGEIREYYITFPYWDTMLHVMNGFLAAAIGYSLIDILNKNERFSISLSPVFVAMVAFCFSMTIGVLWEFIEFGADFFLQTDMQKDRFVDTVRSVLLNPEGKNIPVVVPIESVVVNGETWPGYIDVGLADTMKDLLVNFIGAVVFSVGGFYLKGKRKDSFHKGFTLTKIKDDDAEVKKIPDDIH